MVIKKETLRKANKTIQRQQMVDSGFYNRSKSQTHKSIKDYSRKTKHKITHSI